MSKETNSKRIAFITPVYEDLDASSMLFNELALEFGDTVYIVAVDDGSVKQPLNISNISSLGLRGIVIKLKRNVGHQKAIAIGLNYVAENFDSLDAVVVMDSDGEDMPSSVNNLLKSLSNPDVDLVVAQRMKRVETFKFRAFYIVYKWLFKLLVGHKINFGNFMALKLSSVRRLVSMQELWLHVAGCVVTSKLRIVTHPMDRGPRYTGSSKMNFVGLTLHGFRALMVFAEDVLVRVGIACAFVAVLTILGGIAAILLKIIGFTTPGWFSVALGILSLVFIQTGALTLMTLMLTGVMKNGTIASIRYKDFIDTIHHANPDSNK
jgi:hypothetical protein